MATVIEMTRVRKSAPTTGGALYIEEIVLTTGSLSDAFTFPFIEVIGVVLQVTGDGTIEITADSPDKMEDDTASYTEWDGSSKVNLAVVGFRVTRSSGTVTATITVKTSSN